MLFAFLFTFRSERIDYILFTQRLNVALYIPRVPLLSLQWERQQHIGMRRALRSLLF